MSDSITIQEVPAEHWVACRTKVAFKDLPAEFDRAIPLVIGALDEAGVKPSGPLVARYYEVTPESAEVEIGFVVSESVEIAAPLNCSELPAGKMARMEHWGPFDEIKDSWDRFDALAKDQGLKMRQPCWERYPPKPKEGSDPKDWLTELYWAVA